MAPTLPFLLPKDSRLFFVVGPMKTGTTWLMNVLNEHPSVICRGEMHPVENLTLPTLESCYQHFESLKKWYWMTNNAWNQPFREGNQEAVVTRALNDDLVRFTYEWTICNFLRQSDKKPTHIGDKSPVHSSVAARHLDYYFGFYQPYLIHLVRDPRDVAVSRWFHTRKMQAAEKFHFAQPFESDADAVACRELLAEPERPATKENPFFRYPNFLHDVLNEWTQVTSGLRREGAEHFGSRYLLVRYEDLKSNFVDTLGGILDRMRLDSSTAVIERMQQATDPEKGGRRHSVYRKGKVGGWEKHFLKEDLKLFDDIARPTAHELGYC